MFSKNPGNYMMDQWVAATEDRPETLVEANISHKEMHCTVKPENMHWKCVHNAKQINIIHKNFADAQDEALGILEKNQ